MWDMQLKRISRSLNISRKLFIKSKGMFRNLYKDMQIQLLLGIIALVKLNTVNSNV
jgi:hypothetical protein